MSVTCPASYSMSIGGYFSRGKEYAAHYSPSFSGKVKNVWSYTSTPLWYLTGHKDNLTSKLLLFIYMLQA